MDGLRIAWRRRRTIAAWALLALENLGLRDSVRRAAGLVKERWGESVAGVGNLTIVGSVVGLVIVVASVIAAQDRDAMTTVFVGSFVLFMLLVSAIGVAGQVLSLALYRHATGRPARPFTDAELENALVPRRKLWRHRR